MSKELKLSPQQSAAVEWMRSGEGQEINLQYVCGTRTKDTIAFISP